MSLAGFALLARNGLLACCLALVPVGVLALAFRRQRRVARALGLEPAAGRRLAAAAAFPVAACLMLGIAVAQPVLRTTSHVSARTSSEIVFVIDVSRSMLASNRPGGQTRLGVARRAVAELRSAVPGVPAGLSGLTDRVLPYVFPTLDRGVFSETLASSVKVDAPPPREASTVATTYAPLASLVRDGFYSPGTEHRTCVLVTDGETRGATGSAAALAGGRVCGLVVVWVGSLTDRIYGRNGRVEAGYRPEAAAAATVVRLARATGGTPFSASELGAAAGALKAAAETGPARKTEIAESTHALAPFFGALALVFAALTLLRPRRRNLRDLFKSPRRAYDAAAHI